MEDPAQARAYAEADFSEANQLFLERFARLLPASPAGARVLDLGCGPGAITLDFARRHPGCRITAVDGAEAMLAHAHDALNAAPDLRESVQLECLRLPCPSLPEHAFDIILSNSLLHHLHDPDVLWQTVKRSARAGATVMVMDLARPADEKEVEALIVQYAADAPEVLRRDFRNSLLAAFTPEEIEEQLRHHDLGYLRVERISDRHLSIEGRL